MSCVLVMLNFPVTGRSALRQLRVLACLLEVMEWMGANQQALNVEENEVRTTKENDIRLCQYFSQYYVSIMSVSINRVYGMLFTKHWYN